MSKSIPVNFRRWDVTPLRILVLEDDADVRHLLRTTLQRMGHQVFDYPAPESSPFYPECPCSSERTCVDVIITDQHMYAVTGLAFLSHLELHGCRVPTDRMALFTAGLTPMEREHARRLQCQVFGKPMDFRRLTNWIHGVAISRGEWSETNVILKRET